MCISVILIFPTYFEIYQLFSDGGSTYICSNFVVQGAIKMKPIKHSLILL